MRRSSTAIPALYSVCALFGSVHAESLPRWEFGVGAAAISFPDYRGADPRRNYLLPVPVFVYRGEVFEADREKVRSLLFKSDRAELDISLNGSVPIHSAGNPAREGMPDLDPTLEIGPSLNVKLFESARSKLALRLSLRAVVASNFHSFRNVGVLSNPNFNLDIRALQGWRVGLVAGALIADRTYHDYFYSIGPQYARPGRAAYAAPGGYSGAQFIAAMSRKFEPVWVVAFVKSDLLNRAAFLRSPLVQRRNNLSAGIAVTWTLARSATLVERND